MTTRPAFDAAAYETPELAALNLPLHALGWDMIEAEREVNALTASRALGAKWDAAFDRMIAARAAHAAALETYDAEVAAYCDRADAAEAAAAEAEADEARAAEPVLF